MTSFFEKNMNYHFVVSRSIWTPSSHWITCSLFISFLNQDVCLFSDNLFRLLPLEFCQFCLDLSSSLSSQWWRWFLPDCFSPFYYLCHLMHLQNPSQPFKAAKSHKVLCYIADFRHVMLSSSDGENQMLNFDLMHDTRLAVKIGVKIGKQSHIFCEVVNLI